MLAKPISFSFACAVLYICSNITGLCETTVEPESTTDHDPRPTTEVETTTATTTRTTSTSPPGGEAPRITGSVILTIMSFGFLCFISKFLFEVHEPARWWTTIVGKMFPRFRINKGKLNINQDIQYDNIPALHRNFQIKSLSRREHLINMESNVVVFKNDYNKRHWRLNLLVLRSLCISFCYAKCVARGTHYQSYQDNWVTQVNYPWLSIINLLWDNLC